MSNFSTKLKELINDLTKVILDNLHDEVIDREEAGRISRFILEEKRKITSEDQIGPFLERLKSNFLIFDSFVDNFKKKLVAQKKEEKKIEEIKNQLLNFTQISTKNG